MLTPFIDGSDPAAREALDRLEARLAGFYRSMPAYDAFQPGAESEGAGWHGLIVPLLDRLHASPPRLLELGAGRSGFAKALGPRRSGVVYHAQDITPANRAWLDARADRVHIGQVADLADAGGRYDLVFHTFVLEHVVFPERFLETVDRLLNPGGIHVVICPRYDLPVYLSPSLRHHGPAARIALAIALSAHRLAARLRHRPEFLINTDPAMFSVPWYRDADAVHLVSGFAIDLWHRRRGYAVTRLEPIIRSFRDRVFKRVCLLARAYRKRK